MSTKIKNQLKEVMLMAWTFVKRNGFSMSEAMKCAWANMKLKAAMKQRIVKFYFKKVDGSVREAYGTLKENLIPATSGDNRKKNDTVQVYFDTERQEYEIEEELDGLYKDLKFAYNADEETLCRAFNADSKQEYIKALTEEVDKYEALLEEYNLPEDDGMDYINLQLSQGLPVIRW